MKRRQEGGEKKKKKKREVKISQPEHKKANVYQEKGYTGIRHQAPRWAYIKKKKGERSRHRTQTSPED